MVALGACIESEPERVPSGPGLEVKVAPLNLPGIGFGCYDVEVRNGLGQPVWSRGDTAISFPTDTTTLCSTRFGNGPGGDISYVGPCDFDEPDHEVLLVVDGLYDAGGNALTDYQNPCPADLPCVLDVACAENADTPVTFNLTVMRQANQGFFDVAINFDDIFCSAKVDCTYDAEGNQPIELLFDPETGDRTQTAVVAVACTAGPGEDVDTTLLMNDIRIQCGDAAPAMSAYSLSSCDDAGTMFIGLHQAFSATGIEMKPVDWTRQADGSYTPALAPVDPFPSPYDTYQGLPLLITNQTTSGPDLTTTALGAIFTIDANQNPPFSALQTAFFQRTNLGSWSLAGIVGLHPDSPSDIAFPYDSPVNNYLVLRDQLDGNTVNPFVTVAFRSSSVSYPTLLHLRRPDGYTADCDADVFAGTEYVVMSCKHSSGRWDLLAWDLTASPSTVAPGVGLGLDAFVMPLLPSDFSFNGATVTQINRFYGFGAISGNVATNDRIFATVEIRLSNNSTAHQLVHFRRDAGTWPREQAPFGQDGGPLHGTPNTWDPSSQTYVGHVLDLGGGSMQDVVQGGHFFGGTWRHFVARYNRTADTWSVANEFKSSGFEIGISNETGLFGSAVNYYLAGAGRETESVPWRPFIANVGTPAADVQQVTWLPMPSATGWNFDRMTGTYGDTSFASTSRRLAGNLVDPTGQRRVIEWRFGINGSGTLELQSWYVYAPDDSVDDATTPWGSLRGARSGQSVGPRFAPGANRCPQVLEQYDLGTQNNPIERGIIFDPALDTAGGLAAVDQVVTLTPTVGAIPGTFFVREPVVDTSALTNLPTNGDITLLDPSQAQEGNVWTTNNPKPADVPAHILQYATYFGDEALDCNGQPCNKVFWNTAIAFDPTVPGCTLAFEATAAQTSSLVNGQIPTNSSWPVIVGRVPLTSNPEGDPLPPVEMICRQNPLDSTQLVTLYKPQQLAFPFCHTLGPSGGPPIASNLDCGYTTTTYLELDTFIKNGFTTKSRSTGGSTAEATERQR
jgi:hypothetical protein